MYLMTLLVDVFLLSVYHCSSPLGGDSSCFITVTPCHIGISTVLLMRIKNLI